MAKRSFFLFAMAAVLLAVSLFGGACAAEAGKAPAVRTILLWAGGANMDNPYDGPIADRLMKMMDAEIPDSVNIIVITGGNSMGWKPELPLEGTDSIRTDCNQVWRMKGAHDGQRGALELLEKDGLPGAEKASMSHPDTLKAFIDYGAANWPAEKYDLILIQHGGGPNGWGKDDVFPREDGKAIMSMDEICGALKESAVDRFDILCFYACLMGTVENAVMLSPYADTLVASEENLYVTGIEFNGMLEMLREDPRTDSFLLGRRMVDDTVGGYYSGSDLTTNMNATLSAVSTKNLAERLVPELNCLADILFREAAEPNENGEYAFYDELHSIAKSMEFGTTFLYGYQLYDLGVFVNALGIAESEFDSASDVRELANAYTDVAVRIMNILDDRDGSGDDVLYSRDTDSMHKAIGTFYTRDAEGKLVTDENGLLKTHGLSVFFDRLQTWYPFTFSNTVDGCAALGDLDEASLTYLKRYRDAVMLYALIQGSGRAVYELGGKPDLTVTDILSVWEKLGIAVWDNAYAGGLFPDVGLKDIYEIVKASGFDVDPWLEKIAAQQAQEIMRAEDVTVRLRESPEARETAGSCRLVSEKIAGRQLDGLYLRVKLKADYPFASRSEYDYSDEYMAFGDRYLTGGLSTDLLMPALFLRDSGGNFYRLAYGGQTALEIGLYDGSWYELRDAAGNAALVQIRTEPGNPNHVQVPVTFILDKEKYGGKRIPGLLEFYFSGGEEAPAAGFVPMELEYSFGEGVRPLNDEVFSGAAVSTVGKLKRGAAADPVGPEMAADESDSRGYTLVRVPAKDIGVVKDVLGEYYLRDIYGNELILTDAVAAAEKEPLLKNLAFAEAKAENGTVTVTYGGETLTPDLDYMVYTRDGETLIQGVGEYAGSIVLEDDDK